MLLGKKSLSDYSPKCHQKDSNKNRKCCQMRSSSSDCYNQSQKSNKNIRCYPDDKNVNNEISLHVKCDPKCSEKKCTNKSNQRKICIDGTEVVVYEPKKCEKTARKTIRERKDIDTIITCPCCTNNINIKGKVDARVRCRVCCRCQKAEERCKCPRKCDKDCKGCPECNKYYCDSDFYQKSCSGSKSCPNFEASCNTNCKVDLNARITEVRCTVDPCPPTPLIFTDLGPFNADTGVFVDSELVLF